MNANATMTKVCPYCAEEIQAAAVKCKHRGSWLEGHPEMYSPIRNNGHASPAFGGKTRLCRSTTDVKLAGVCAGIAHMLHVDPTFIRVAYAIATLFTAIAPGVIVYIILAMLIPKDDQVA